MPTYIDSHKMGGSLKKGEITPERLKEIQNAPKDKFGITHHDLVYNKEGDTVYCILNAPDKQSVIDHHKQAGIECEWIQEVESARL